MKSVLSSKRGVALILVIMIMSILVTLTIQLSRASRSEFYEAVNVSDGIELMYIAKSGFAGGQAILADDVNSWDSLNENWAQAGLVSSASASLLERGLLMVHIKDETGKIPLNNLVKGNEYNGAIRDLCVRFLNLPEFGLSEDQVGDIVDAIKDWLDEDDEQTGFGAENIYYQNLADPYSCKNGALDCVDELLMIKGITSALLYGTEDTPGIAPFFAVHGGEKLNINTVPPLLMQALAEGITEDMVSAMNDYRRNPDNDLANPGWYKNVTGMDGTTIDETLLATHSDIFEITSAAYLNGMKRTITGVVKRGDNKKINIISWKLD